MREMLLWAAAVLVLSCESSRTIYEASGQFKLLILCGFTGIRYGLSLGPNQPCRVYLFHAPTGTTWLCALHTRRA